MKVFLGKSLPFLALVAVFSLPTSANATPITVVNGDFSQLPASGLNMIDSKGNYSIGSITGWANSGTSGQYAPVGSIFVGYDGTNTIAWSVGPTISQTVSATVQEGVRYTFTIDIGHRTDSAFTGGADLLINGTRYSATGLTPVAGFFSTFTATYVGTAADAGSAITLELTSSGSQGDYDNAALSSTPVPEPSSIALLGTGLLGAAGLARRKFRSA